MALGHAGRDETAMSRVIAVFNLKAQVLEHDYEAWAKRVDIPTVNALPSVGSFEVLKVTGQLGSDAPPPYRYIEVIDIQDEEGFARDVASAPMQKIASEFRAMVDVAFLKTERVG
jgi:hypothetical protein